MLGLTRLFAAALLVLAAVPARGDGAVGPLTEPSWLARYGGTPAVVVLDARSDWYAYKRGHIPGAVFTHYGRDGWRARRGGVPGMLPPVADLERLIGRLGIGNATHVVVVAPGRGAGDMGIATRIYWTFKVLGHDRVSVLAGGMRAYVAAGLPLSRKPRAPRPAVFKANFRRHLLATRDDVRAALASGGRLIDNRPPVQFMGKRKSGAAKRFGTIPGARNVPAVFMTPKGSGAFHGTQTMERLFAASGTRAGDDAITFCNTGHWASVGWFVQSELLGRKNVRLYDGSMAEWRRDAANPMVRAAR